MSNDAAAQVPAKPSEAPRAPEINKGAGKKSGNVTVTAATARFMESMKKAAAPAAVPVPGDANPPAAPAVVPLIPGADSTPPAQTAVPPVAPSPVAPAQPAAPATDPDDAADPGTDLSQFSALDPKTRELVQGLLEQQKARIQEKVDRRINKEIAKRLALEAQVQQHPAAPAPAAQPPAPQVGLLPQAQAVPQAPAIPPGPVPLADVSDGNGLVAKAQEAREYRQKADDALALGPGSDGHYVIDGQQLTKEQVVQVRRNASDVLEVHVPQRHQFLMQRQQALQIAYQQFPWLSNPQTPEYQQAVTFLNQAPYLRNMPNAEIILGTLVEGTKAVNARQQAAAAPAAPAPAPRQRPPGDQVALGGSSAAPRASASTAAQQRMSDELGKLKGRKGVNVRDVASYLAQRDQLSQPR